MNWINWRPVTCGILILIIGLFFIGCKKLEDPDVNIPASSIITLKALDKDLSSIDYILADSQSFVLIQAVLTEKTSPDQSIVFTTSHGVLSLPGQSPLQGKTSLSVKAAYREATVVLHAGNQSKSEVLISAVVGEYLNVLPFAFKTAYPEVFNVKHPFYDVGTSDTVAINVQASRSNGRVSDGVIFKLENLNPDSISLNLPNYGTLNNQTGVFNISNPSGKSGTVKVKMSIPSSETDSISQTLEIKFN